MVRGQTVGWHITRSLPVLLLVMLLLLIGPSGAVYSQPVHRPASGDKVLVDAGDAAGLAALQISGAQQLVDYGAFSLWRLPANAALAAAPTLNAVDDTIQLRDLTITPGQSQPLSAPNAAAPAGGAGLWMVQFIGPPQPAWIDALTTAGLQIAAYIPHNAYLVWGDQPAQQLANLSSQMNVIQWTGPYQPDYRLAPDLRALAHNPSQLAGPEPQLVTVQFYNTPGLASSLAQLKQIAGGYYQLPVSLQTWTNVQVQLTAPALADVATWPDVLNIEPYAPPILLDEIQGQILAGNLKVTTSGVVPTGPGYLAWLMAKGFPSDPAAYPIVDLFDDGIDSGSVSNVLHPDFYLLGDKTRAGRIMFIDNCTQDPVGNGVGGHGNLNAGLVAGYNDRTGAPYQDGQGYHLGLGISPFGRIAATKIFNNYGAYDIAAVGCDSSLAKMVNRAYSQGARITSNSWGIPVSGSYDAMAQQYDVLTRDASALPANQQMLHVFAAGNEGPNLQTLGTPGSAKNVLTVGATESVRSSGELDGCLKADASSADNVAAYSSAGPAKDGRIKPDIMAPGTHIQGPASLDAAFTGGAICGGFTSNHANTPYHPENQRLYTWSSGTSHAAPAVSGIAQLLYNYYQRFLKPGLLPSPAVLKALILNTPRYLTGHSANDTLPSPTQGWGDGDMGQIFDKWPRLIFDQSQLMTATGQTFDLTAYIANPSHPLHATLVWTDAPGSTAAGAALVNNLDLVITAGGKTYYGNVFNGPTSVTGGQFDSLNNVESVFLPAGIQGPITVHVIARSVAGDGVPGNAYPLDQDFALVVYNAVTKPLSYRTWMPISGNYTASPSLP